MLTHRNLLSPPTARAGARDRARKGLSPLPPLAHVFARLTVHLCMHTGNTVAIAEGIHRIAENMKEVARTSPPGFPAFTRRSATGSGRGAKVAAAWAGPSSPGARRRAEASRLEQQGRPVPPWLALRRARRQASRLSADPPALRRPDGVLISGAAPLDPRTAEFFHACGLLILEGIGMTENASFSNVNRRERFKFGTVGPVGPGIEMKVASDGEILFRAPNVMKGYLKSPRRPPSRSTRRLAPHRGCRSVDDDGFLRVTDRKKDLIVTSGGKNVAPQRIERALQSSPYIAQAVVFGDRRKYLTALLTLDWRRSRVGRRQRRGRERSRGGRARARSRGRDG